MSLKNSVPHVDKRTAQYFHDCCVVAAQHLGYANRVVGYDMAKHRLEHIPPTDKQRFEDIAYNLAHPEE